MKRLIAFAALAVLVLAVSGCQKKQAAVETAAVEPAAKPDYVAVVNGVKIPRSIFDEELAKVTQNGVRKIPEDRLLKISDNIVNRLIEEELLTQEVRKQGVVVTPEETEAQYDEYKARFKGEEQFDNYLKHGKVTPEIIKERLTRSYSLTKLLDKLGKLSVSDEDIQNAYNAGIRMFTDPEQVHAAHILVRLNEKDDAEKEKEAKAKIEGALKKLKKGEDFGEIAKAVSEDTTTAPKGGDLGFFKAGQMVPAFEKAAFALKAGEYTREAVRTPFGLHLIKSFEKKPERVRPLDEVREKVATSLRNKAMFKARRELVKSLRSTAEIEKLEGDVNATGADPAPAAVPAAPEAPAPAPQPAVEAAPQAPAPAPANAAAPAPAAEAPAGN
ncbi:MAG TPA: peptidylprolyl isomerase [Myxococcota bacterium]|nr:peptidylprolyl isomerase [Myxococcota bacterium]HOC99838.1 peptidylprolyl isomerase [Myxococcota bacterium]HOH76245.1 peptidylprolyl isomerase [Myxococcota bacterium]HPV03012.1 peptidylprolyl isomerase [Myxococcota bacterium]